MLITHSPKGVEPRANADGSSMARNVATAEKSLIGFGDLEPDNNVVGTRLDQQNVISDANVTNTAQHDAYAEIGSEKGGEDAILKNMQHSSSNNGTKPQVPGRRGKSGGPPHLRNTTRTMRTQSLSKNMGAASGAPGSALSPSVWKLEDKFDDHSIKQRRCRPWVHRRSTWILMTLNQNLVYNQIMNFLLV
ncbi:hypothetical protein QAD02_002625 [Eretmocerus hayati]|uniref:Uncharacterized protein n=1 Tax=Eretmocerus hayati TaxID=131215 RepID=A0ACC2NL72_9HYME|nr:hypothetical protein QAD02_002625 [Eretmocerus hayati]